MPSPARVPKSHLNVIVVGAGVFGRNHLRIYRELEQAGNAVRLTAVVDTNLAAANAAAAEAGVPAFTTVDQCLLTVGVPDAASVCVPTLHHATASDPLLRAGVDVLIEKPLAASLSDADHILNLSRWSGALVQAGHLERFNPAVTAARPYLTRPMFFEAHRLSVFTPRSLDIDVVLDLMIHDLDIVLSYVQSPIREIRAVGLPVLSGKVDIANVRLEFHNGAIANFTASRVSTERVRKLRFFQPRQYLSLDFARQDLLIIDAPDINPLTPLPPTTPGHPSAGLSLQQIPVQTGEPLRIEIESFLTSVRSGQPPAVSGADGRAALKLALDINAAIRDHATRAGL